MTFLGLQHVSPPYQFLTLPFLLLSGSRFPGCRHPLHWVPQRAGRGVCRRRCGVSYWHPGRPADRLWTGSSPWDRRSQPCLDQLLAHHPGGRWTKALHQSPAVLHSNMSCVAADKWELRAARGGQGGLSGVRPSDGSPALLQVWTCLYDEFMNGP